MKHRFLLIVAAVSAVMALGTPATAETKIVYATHSSPKQPINTALERFFARVKEQTDGQVVWEGHYGASLLGPKDIPSGVRDDIVDAGYFIGVYVPSEMPVDNYIGDFSMLNEDAIAMTGAMNELVLLKCPECADEYKKGFNTQFLGTYTLTSYVLQCKPYIKSLADIKGKRVRAFAGWVDMFKAMGAVPVGVSVNEMYEALQRGILDCATHTITNQRTRSYGEVAHNIVLNSLGGYMGGSPINMRLDKWRELTSKQREVILKNLPELIADWAYSYVNDDAAVRKEMEAKGNKFYYADKDLGNFIKNFREEYVQTEAIEKGRERGVKDPKKIADTIFALSEKWERLLKENGREKATFERLLWTEVYSKVPVNN